MARLVGGRVVHRRDPLVDRLDVGIELWITDRRPHELERVVGDAVGDEAGARALMSPTVNTQRKPPRPVRSNRKNPRSVGLLT